MPSRLVAIHQPNFLPWLGFFDKVARADVMVLLDSVQFPKKGGTWTNRVKMLVGGEPGWVTVPIDRSYHGLRRIAEVQISEQRPWRRKVLATIETSYGRSPGFDEVMPLVSGLIEDPTDSLADYNVRAIESLVEQMGVPASEMVLSSSIETEGSATDLLIEIVRAVDGDAYLAGGGAGSYQEDQKFEAAGIELVPQAFRHPSYPQPTGEPVHGLSVVDALMSCGLNATGELLDGGRA